MTNEELDQAQSNEAAETIIRLHAEEAELEQCCKDLDLQITDLTTANERLVRERDEAREGLEGLEAAAKALSEAAAIITRLVMVGDQLLTERNEHMAARGELFTRALKAEAKADNLLRKFSWEKDQ